MVQILGQGEKESKREEIGGIMLPMLGFEDSTQKTFERSKF